MCRRSRKDYPKGVLGIYDTGPNKSVDRYTVVYEPFIGAYGQRYFPYVTMSADPFWPQGVCMYGESLYRPTSSAWGNTRLGCGRTINFADLPEDCKKVVMQDLTTEDNVNE